MAHASSFNHTSATVDSSCNQAYFSPDGNPFTLCPGPYPTGGNCVWWAWEQWHLLGYDLPLNWGNAADWIVDADRSGLPLGTTPRLGSIAVFPRADGVWAFGAEGHVAFVTGVSPDNSTFNVTYQNYGDPTPMHVGTGYDVSVINEPRYQDGEMRFIYFPRLIDPVRFSHLPGVDGNGVSQVPVANSLLSSSNTSGNSQIALGLPPGSLDQEFSADFTGSGFTELLLYNRQQGHLDIVTFSDKLRPQKRITPNLAHYLQQNQPVNSYVIPQRVSLSDATTPANGWGSNLDIHIGDFTGSGRSQILLYDRMSGEIQILGLTPQLKIQEHVILPGWGPGWEIYVGQYDGHRSGVFMYNRSAFSNPTATLPAGPTSSTTSPVGPTPGSTSTPQPSPNPTAKPTPSPTAKPSPSPTPSPRPSPSPSPSPTSSPSPTAKPTPSPSPSPTAKPKPTPSPSPSPSPSPTATPSPTSTNTSGANLDIEHTIIDTIPKPGDDLSGSVPQGAQGSTPNIFVLDFKKDFSIDQEQQYTLSNNSWEVYIGRFVNPHQDGIFLYDRTTGEARVMNFDSKMVVARYQQIHNLPGNWEVHSGDFNGSGRAQLLLYDPGSGDAQFLVLGSDLSLVDQKSFSGWKTSQVLYVGHFGLSSLSAMLYDQKAGQSTFIAFNSSLGVIHQYTISSWSQNSQVLIGSFLDRSRCLATHTCNKGDDILV